MLAPPPSSPRILVVDGALPVARVLDSFLSPYSVEITTSGASVLARLAALLPVDLRRCDLAAARPAVRQPAARAHALAAAGDEPELVAILRELRPA